MSSIVRGGGRNVTWKVAPTFLASSMDIVVCDGAL